MQNSIFTSGDIVSSYTRADAIEDGVLIDVTETAKEAGFTVPVAVTSAVYAKLLEPTAKDKEYRQSVEGRLWDVLSMLRFAIRKAPKGARSIAYSVLVSHDGETVEEQLQSAIGPGDHGEPVITIMLPVED